MQFLKKFIPSDVKELVRFVRSFISRFTYDYKGQDQWSGQENTHNISVYNDLIKMNKKDILKKYPLFYDRMNATISHVWGDVLEVGCGNGNITRWIACKDDVCCIDAFDLSSIAVDKLISSDFIGIEKVRCVCCSLSDYVPDVARKFDTILMSEVIEHISLEEELRFLSNISNNIVKCANSNGNIEGTTFIVSTPINFMPDPNHCRGFSKRQFIKHINKYYGSIRGVSYTDCQQIIWGNFQ